MKNKRNVMWRACIDLQNMVDELMLKRAEVIGKRRRSSKTHRRSEGRGRGAKPDLKKRKGTTSNG